MSRHFLSVFICITLVCCQKDSSRGGMVQQSFAITRGSEDILSAVKSLAQEAKNGEVDKKSSELQGLKADQARSLRNPASFKSRDEELEYYEDVIFQSLGYPLQKEEGSEFKVLNNHELVVRHRKEAIEQFERLLERWKRSNSERWHDMLNGKK